LKFGLAYFRTIFNIYLVVEFQQNVFSLTEINTKNYKTSKNFPNLHGGKKHQFIPKKKPAKKSFQKNNHLPTLGGGTWDDTPLKGSDYF